LFTAKSNRPPNKPKRVAHAGKLLCQTMAQHHNRRGPSYLGVSEEAAEPHVHPAELRQTSRAESELRRCTTVEVFNG
jgi:hypothetical protein